MDIIAKCFKELDIGSDMSSGDHSKLICELRTLADQLEANPKMSTAVTYVTLDPVTNLTTVYSGYAGHNTICGTFSESEAYVVECLENTLFNAAASNISLSYDNRQLSGNAFDKDDQTLDIWFGPSRDDESNLISVVTPNG